MFRAFKSVTLNGRQFFNEGDTGGSGAGADDAGTGAAGSDAGDTGGQGGDGGADGGEVDDLDLPTISKRQASEMIRNRVNETKKGFADAAELREIQRMLGDVVGTQDLPTLKAQIAALHSQHMAKATGTTPQGFAYQQQQAAQSRQANEDTRRMIVNQEFDRFAANKKDFPEAALHKEEIIETSLKGLSMEQAYWAVAGQSAVKKAAAAAAADGEQRARTNMQSRQGKQIQPGESGAAGGASNKAATISPEIAAMAKQVGMEPEEYAAYMNISTIDEANAYKKSKRP